MSVPVESIKPGTVWRLRDGSERVVIETLAPPKAKVVWRYRGEGRRQKMGIDTFARHAIEQVTP